MFVYAFSVLYIAFRYAIYLLVRKRNEFKDHTVLRYSLTPSIRPWVWDFVIEREREFNVGLISFQSINWIHTFKKDHEKSDYMKLALENQNAKHFLANAQFPYMIEIQHHDVIEVQIFDLRFRNKEQYPFLAQIIMTKDFTVVDSRTGWLHAVKHSQPFPFVQQRNSLHPFS